MSKNESQATEEIFHQAVGKIDSSEIFQIPWRHHCLIMDKVRGDVDKALF